MNSIDLTGKCPVPPFWKGLDLLLVPIEKDSLTALFPKEMF